MNLFRRLNSEIEICFATILISIFLKLNIKPNSITFISIIVAYLSIILILIIQDYYVYPLLIILYTIHSWDYADGEVARRTNSTSFYGHLLDESATTIIRNGYYLWISIYLITLNYDFWTSIMSIFLVFLRHNNFKNLFYRVALTKFSPRRKDNSENTSRIYSVEKPYINFLKRIINVLRLNDFRLIVITITIHLLFNINFVVYTSLALIILQLIRNVLDIIWIKNSEMLNSYFLD
jgi:hypothetical protein